MQLPVVKEKIDPEMLLVFLLIVNEIEELISKIDPLEEPPGEE